MLQQGSEIVHQSLSAQLANALEKDILNGVYVPGQRLTETELSERFKVSRSPLREALYALESRGFLEKEPYKGMRVVQVTTEEAMEIFVIRANLESLAVSLTIQRQDQATLERVKHIHEELKKAATVNDTEKYYELNLLFHKSFHQGCGNNRLIKMLKDFNKKTQRYRREYFKTSNQMKKSLKSHQKLIDYFEQNKPDEAEKYRKETLIRNSKVLVNKIHKNSQ